MQHRIVCMCFARPPSSGSLVAMRGAELAKQLTRSIDMQSNPLSTGTKYIGPDPCVRAHPCPAQIGQLYKIFRVLGTPDATVWPGIEELPDWQPGFPKWQRQDLTQARLLFVCHPAYP